MFIGMIFSAVIILAVDFYMNLGSDVGIVIATIFCVLYFAFILVQNFVYNLMVSTDLKLGKIYKNAILFTLTSTFAMILILAAILIVAFRYRKNKAEEEKKSDSNAMRSIPLP